MYGAGTVVAGKYRIDRTLGEGGMGVVVAATHIHLDTPVALKFLHRDLMQNAGVVERFMREARKTAQLRGENVCRVSDVGTAEDGCPFIVMELLTGQDLATVLGQNGMMPMATAVDIMLQACLAIGEAHALGIVHRDIKPGNLFWTQRTDGTACIKVLDFGVAKAPGDVNFSLTQTASVIGSPGYMSPEQLKSSRAVDARSDIWSLGVVLYEMVSGRKPFVGESITELALHVTLEPAPPLMGAVPEMFERIISKCLEKDPAKRFQDVAELAAALAPYLGARGEELAHGIARVLRGAHTPLPVATRIPQTPTTLRGATGMVDGGGGGVRRTWMLPAVMGLGAAVGVMIAILMISGNKGESAGNAEGETTKMESAATPAGTPPTTKMAAAPTTPKGETTPTNTDSTKPDTKVATTSGAKAEPTATSNAATTTTADTTPKSDAKVAATKADTTKTDAKTDTTSKADAAKVAATKADTTKTDTTTKADVAKVAATKTDATADATTKADVAKVAATKADTTTKADAAKADAKTTKTAKPTKKKSTTKTATSDKPKADAKTTKTTKPKPGTEDVFDSRF